MRDLKMEHKGIEWLAQKIHEGKIMNPLKETDIAIIRALALNGMRISKAAMDAHVCRKTINNRIERIRAQTGLDALDFYGLCQLLILVDKLEGKKKHGKA